MHQEEEEERTTKRQTEKVAVAVCGSLGKGILR